VGTQSLAVEGLDVSFDGATTTATVAGVVPDQATKEKVLLCCGNVAGRVGVNDMLVVKEPAPEAQWHTVVSGDNLSKIAKKFYGDANKYPVIFEANKPMLSTRTRSIRARCCASRRSEAAALPPGGAPQRQFRGGRAALSAGPCSALIAPAPMEAPKRLASRSATFSLGV
jgi:hypothetical protein